MEEPDEIPAEINQMKHMLTSTRLIGINQPHRQVCFTKQEFENSKNKKSSAAN